MASLRSHGTKPRTLAVPAGRVQQAGEHLQGGGFPGAVRAEKPDEIALGDLKGDIIHGARLRVFAMEKPFEARRELPVPSGTCETSW